MIIWGIHDIITNAKFGWKCKSCIKNLFCHYDFLKNETLSNYFYDKFLDFAIDFSGLGNHVCTANLNLIRYKDVMRLLKAGLNHIPSRFTLGYINAILNCMVDIVNDLLLGVVHI